jgi:gamma-glutamyltranspeptidase / glutathione hydrolase
MQISGAYGAASGHPLAAEAGLAALRAGGSAVDAVLTAAFAQWVVNGPLCGPGGDLFVLYLPSDGQTAQVFGGWSRTPLGFPVDGPIESSGPRGAVIPGSLAGAAAASFAACRLPWGDLFEAALRLAHGHKVTEWMARSYRSVVEKGHGAALSSFLDQGATPLPGDVVSCTRLAKTLRVIAEYGADEFYRGSLGEQIAAASATDGGYVTQEDLAAMTADVAFAATHDLTDVAVVVPPAPSQAGIVARIMEAAPPELAAESTAYASATAPVIEQELTDRCIVGVPGTAVSVASDGVGMAAVVHSLAGVQFGTGWVAGDTGVALGNRVGTALTTRPELAAARPVPGAQLPHTLSAAIFRSGGRTALVATPGGDRQVQWLAQAGQRFRRGEALAGIASGPRWFVCPEGDRFGVPGGIGSEWFLFGEPGVEWSAEERVAGYRVRRTETVGGGIQAIEKDTGGWSFASDPRAGGDSQVARSATGV